MTNSEKRFTLRMSQELFDEVKLLAVREHRSVAKQIEYMLSQYLLIERDKKPIMKPIPKDKM